MTVKSTGVVTFSDKNGAVQKREGRVYLQFSEGCMQNYFEGFAYNRCWHNKAVKEGKDRLS